MHNVTSHNDTVIEAPNEYESSTVIAVENQDTVIGVRRSVTMKKVNHLIKIARGRVLPMYIMKMFLDKQQQCKSNEEPSLKIFYSNSDCLTQSKMSEL